MKRLKKNQIVAVNGNLELVHDLLIKHGKDCSYPRIARRLEAICTQMGNRLVTWGEIKDLQVQMIMAAPDYNTLSARPRTCAKNAKIEAGMATAVLRNAGIIVEIN